MISALSESTLLFIDSDADPRLEFLSKFVLIDGNLFTIPFAPHLLLPQYISEEHERGLAMFKNKVFLWRFNKLWISGVMYLQGCLKK